MSRQLTIAEKHLIKWMLQNGHADAREFLPQLESAWVTPYKCPCGCPTINLVLEGSTEPSGGLHIIADFVFDANAKLSGAFVYEKQGVLAGLEIYGLAGDAPKELPSPDILRSWEGYDLPSYKPRP